MKQIVHLARPIMNKFTYETAIEALNGLQSNSDYLRNAQGTNNKSNKMVQMRKYIKGAGMSLDSLENMNVIHVTGTKGKGSTSAFCESILRRNGYKTGFFSSPHLISVTERIRINGQPIKKEIFSKYFWQVYQDLEKQADSLPMYFQLLTILTFKVFLEEQIEVAILEVGIGGEYDCTNFLKGVKICGITSLGIDHTPLLGNTISEIAWHKAGIMKEGCKTFTLPQPPEAMDVLKQRSLEKKCELIVVDVAKQISDLFDTSQVTHLNATLGFNLANAWITSQGKQLNPHLTKVALQECRWPGRYQIIQNNKDVYFLDGAHTSESIKLCCDWFKQKSPKQNRVLIYNSTGNRNVENQLQFLQQIFFQKVFFVPNKANQSDPADVKYFNQTANQQETKCGKHKLIWEDLSRTNEIKNKQHVSVASNLMEILLKLDEMNEEYDILVTGSIHLVGAMLSILDPHLER